MRFAFALLCACLVAACVIPAADYASFDIECEVGQDARDCPADFWCDRGLCKPLSNQGGDNSAGGEACPDLHSDEDRDGDCEGQAPSEGEGGGNEGGGDEGGGGEGGGAGFTKLYDDHLNKCAVCHAPGAGGFIAGTTEATLDFSSRDQAYSSITTGKASGLSGNVGGCNDVPFVGSSSGKSLIVAVLDEDVRAAYDNSSFPDCNGDSITDMSFRTNPGVPDSIVSGVKAWIDEGASND